MDASLKLANIRIWNKSEHVAASAEILGETLSLIHFMAIKDDFYYLKLKRSRFCED